MYGPYSSVQELLPAQITLLLRLLDNGSHFLTVISSEQCFLEGASGTHEPELGHFLPPQPNTSDHR